MLEYKLRVDKQQKLIDLVISFPKYVPYGVLAEICDSIKQTHDAGGVKINPRYSEADFSIDKMADILSEFKVRNTFGRGFFNGATAEFASMAADNGEISIVDTASFDELASVVEDDSSIVIKLRNGGLGILTYAGCDEDISKIIYEWFGLSKKIIFSGKTTLEYDEFRSMNPVPIVHYNPMEIPREAPPIIQNQQGGEKPGGFNKYRQKVELPADFVPRKNSIYENEPVCEVNYDEGWAKSGNMIFDISEPEPCYGIIKDFEITPIRNLNSESKKVTIMGKVFSVEKKLLKSGEKYLLIFYITDNDSSMVCKTIYNVSEDENFSKITEGGFYAMCGNCSVDTFDATFPTVFKPTAFSKICIKTRKDNAPEKRVELHLHTNMSAMDATADPKDIIKQVQKWGQGAVAITDHGNLQAFPQSMLAREKLGNDVKVIYGIESYFVDDNARAVYGEKDALFQEDEFVIFDLETTGTSPQNCAITEIGAVKYKNGEIYDEFCTFVNPEMPIPEKITEITGISDD
ncbi:MAG: PHP domain-containing protein, partial [Clostridia bacterium]|nr:PHP domain-containing protein [Clostridia bacterium]